MWNPFKKKTVAPPKNEGDPPPNSVDALANELHRSGRADDLERELERLDQSKLTAAEQESWWHLYGITAFRSGRNNEATERFEAGSERFPNSKQIRFSLGQQYVMSGEIERGFQLFQSCIFPEVSREFVMAQVRYAYLWDRYAEARAMLHPFLAFYRKMGILDDHFLYVRGLPFFGTWWSYLAAISILSGDTKDLEEITADVSKNCSDYDFEYLQCELAAYRDDKPELMLATLRKILSESPKNFPNGYTQMKMAVVLSRTASNPSEATSFLTDVPLLDQDPHWLEDVRTLAKAEIAHRFKQVDLEETQIKAFLLRQPTLFEPNIALNFHLLRYQENLKPRFRANIVQK